MHSHQTLINPNTSAPRFANHENVARTMSSREIANITGKRHDNVKRDILAMLKDLKANVLKFEDIYLDGRNREQVQYLLDREHTDCLLTGYSPALRMKVIRRWRNWRGSPSLGRLSWRTAPRSSARSPSWSASLAS